MTPLMAKEIDRYLGGFAFSTTFDKVRVAE